GASAAAIYARRRAPYLFVGWFWFLVTLLPVIGLVQVGSQPWADRYTYVPAVGLFVLAVWGLADLVPRWPVARTGLAAAATVSVIALAMAARLQVGHWESGVALWLHAASVTTENYRALANLGHALWLDRRPDEAVREYRAALQVKPD